MYVYSFFILLTSSKLSIFPPRTCILFCFCLLQEPTSCIPQFIFGSHILDYFCLRTLLFNHLQYDLKLSLNKISIFEHFSHQFLSTCERYILKKVGDRQHAFDIGNSSDSICATLIFKSLRCITVSQFL